MGDIINAMNRQPAVFVSVDKATVCIPMVFVRKIASGELSVLEFQDPETTARALAKALIDEL